MQTRSRFLTLSLMALALVFVGAGCIQIKGSGSNVTAYGLWKSMDGGENWEQVTALPTARGVGNIQGVQIHELIQDPSDRFALYAGTITDGLFYTYDGAESWQRIREPNLREGRVRSLAVDPNNKCTVYATRAQRLFKSTDCGRTFNKEAYVDARGDVILTDVEVDWFNPNVVYLANTEGEVLRSNNAGGSWTTIYRANSAINDLMIDAKDSRWLLLSTARRGVHLSQDGGSTWVDVLKDDRYDDLDNARQTYDLVQDARGDYTWLATKYGLLLSRDRGQSWSAVQLLTPPGDVEITALAVDPKRGERLIYGAGTTLYLTENAGENWDTERMPVNARASQLLFDADDSRVVYMGAKEVEKDPTLF